MLYRPADLEEATGVLQVFTERGHEASYCGDQLLHTVQLYLPTGIATPTGTGTTSSLWNTRHNTQLSIAASHGGYEAHLFSKQGIHISRQAFKRVNNWAA